MRSGRATNQNSSKIYRTNFRCKIQGTRLIHSIDGANMSIRISYEINGITRNATINSKVIQQFGFDLTFAICNTSIEHQGRPEKRTTTYHIVYGVCPGPKWVNSLRFVCFRMYCNLMRSHFHLIAPSIGHRTIECIAGRQKDIFLFAIAVRHAEKWGEKLNTAIDELCECGCNRATDMDWWHWFTCVKHWSL